MSRAIARVRAAALVLVLMGSLAPTAGDIGGCGQAPELLDPAKLYQAKRLLDCARCTGCGFDSQRCAQACAGELEVSTFPEGCTPLVHDGEVCLGALRAAGCAEYEAYMVDQGAVFPSECDFCPIDAKPTADGGAP